MEAIIDHQSNNSAVKEADEYVVVNNKRHQIKTTKGWELCIQWKDGMTMWQRLADMKESNPVEVAEYAVAATINYKPAFAWWVDWTLKQRDCIIAAVNNCTLKRTHKFGIAIPRTVEEACKLDKENGNYCWAKAITKEMTNVQVAFQVLSENKSVPVGYQFI
jgi:hypothetical protein